MKKMWFAALMAAVLAIPSISHAGVAYTSGASDGVAIRSKNMSFIDTYVSPGGDSLDGLYWYYGGADTLQQYPVMQFSLAPFKHIEDTTDLTALLNFYVISGSNIDRSYVRFVDSNGTGTITYAQGTGGSKVGENLTQTGWQTFDITEQLETALSKNYDWITFNLHMPNWDMDVNIVSSEGATGAYADMSPQIAVYIPEPATLTILGTGLLALLRRKK
ncbi:MAG: PEP-CTERM sorting domain-containing protein [Phycisphaerae bacterium]|nr:PEP-CTERM sorting domain-containing protein [Phycisphaerae bacterium]